MPQKILGAASSKHAKRFHQCFSTKEKRYLSRWNVTIDHWLEKKIIFLSKNTRTSKKQIRIQHKKEIKIIYL